jgi:hypothetical protein
MNIYMKSIIHILLKKKFWLKLTIQWSLVYKSLFFNYSSVDQLISRTTDYYIPIPLQHNVKQAIKLSYVY